MLTSFALCSLEPKKHNHAEDRELLNELNSLLWYAKHNKDFSKEKRQAFQSTTSTGLSAVVFANCEPLNNVLGLGVKFCNLTDFNIQFA